MLEKHCSLNFDFQKCATFENEKKALAGLQASLLGGVAVLKSSQRCTSPF